MPERTQQEFLDRIRRASEKAGRRVRIMEVCGTHTHAIARAGLKKLFSEYIHLVSGPGCPVCVTSQRDIERMLVLARMKDVTITTFGDMIRVPGTKSSLEQVRAQGGDIRVVYSPLDALRTAAESPGREVIFLAVGFETTAPTIAAVALRAREEKLPNFSLYVSHKLIIPAMTAVMEGDVDLDGFLTPGHVSVIIGARAYTPIADRYGIPCVVTGFDPIDVLEGLATLTELIANGRNESAIQYTRAATHEGNTRAYNTMMSAFAECDAEWRGLGVIPGSGLRLKEGLGQWDAERRFEIPDMQAHDIAGCRCGEVLKGLLEPDECGFFGKRCTPRNPVGPCMVSSEGSCAARYRYG